MKKISDFKPAFSLMEMMVVLLIISIVAAATAPMVSKKLARNAEQSDNPWVYPNLGNNIAYNLRGANNATAIIGATTVPNGAQNPRLYINGNGGIAFGDGGNYRGSVRFLNNTSPSIAGYCINIGHSNRTTDENIIIGSVHDDSQPGQGAYSIGWGTRPDGSTSIAIGGGATTYGNNSISLGGDTITYSNSSIAIGPGASTGMDGFTSDSEIAIGNGASAPNGESIAIGKGAYAHANSDIAIGAGAYTGDQNNNSTAIGAGATVGAYGVCSTAIGAGATVSGEHRIVLGTANETVIIPGNLVVDGDVTLANESNRTVRIRVPERGGVLGTLHTDDAGGFGISIISSDRRLKNVGEKFKGGLEELKKLDLYHYTFKKDKDKTPHVGVMAQDLQKVFPNAVKEGEDGYLRIRWDEMFYAVINAVKELDTKITAIVEQVKVYSDKVAQLEQKIEEQQNVISKQQKAITELQKQNAEFDKRLKNLEKNKK